MTQFKKTLNTNLNTEFSADKRQMAEKHLKIDSTSQSYPQSLLKQNTKTTLIFHHMQVRMLTTNYTNNSSCQSEYGVKEILIHYCWMCTFSTYYGNQFCSSSRNLEQVYTEIQLYNLRHIRKRPKILTEPCSLLLHS